MTPTNVNLHQYYRFLDGLRAVGIFAVLLSHICGIFDVQHFPGNFYPRLMYLGAIGYIGVDLFFIISGFLITGILIKDFKSDIHIGRFYKRRFFKIFPQYFLLLLFILFFSPYVQASVPFNLTTYLFFIQNYTQQYGLLSHTWSLSIEEHFYLLYPLIVGIIFFLIKEHSRRRFALLITLLFLIILVMLGRHGANGKDFLSQWLNVASFYQTTLFRVDGLLWGCVLKVLEPFYSQIKISIKAYIAPFLLCITIGILYYFTTTYDSHFKVITWDPYLWGYLAMICLFMAGYFRFKPLNMIIEHPLMVWIGKISYGMFLWHFPLVYIFALAVPRTYGVSVNIIGLIGATVLMGAVTTFTVEKYFLRVRDRVVP